MFEAVDLGTMESIRDITPIITVSDGAFVEQSLSSETWTTGQIGFAGARSWLTQLVRVSVCEDDHKEILGTFFPSLSDISYLSREVATGTLRLDGTLIALKGTLLPTSYVIASGASATQVIQDMCALSGVHADISKAEGDYRYPAPVFFDAGESALSVASEAAELAGVHLVSDRLGYVSTRGDASIRGGATFVSGVSTTDLLSEISKSYAFLSSPTRIVAAFTDTGTALFTTVDLDDTPQGASTRGRNFDASLSVSSLPSPDLATLRAVAKDALIEQSQETWSFLCSHRELDAGDMAVVMDYDSSETLEGHVESIKTFLTGLCEQEITIKGGLR